MPNPLIQSDLSLRVKLVIRRRMMLVPSLAFEAILFLTSSCTLLGLGPNSKLLELHCSQVFTKVKLLVRFSIPY
jgi:hypothetical protein